MIKSLRKELPSGEYNIISSHLRRLRTRNYITKAEPQNGRYWFNFYENKLIKDYITPFNKNFSLIIRGSDAKKLDFFAIPYPVLEPFLASAFMNIDERTGTRRWIFNITKDHVLQTQGFYLDVNPYYGNLSYVFDLPKEVK